MPGPRAPSLPHHFGRGSSSNISIQHRAVLYARLPERLRWMENETARSGMPAQVALCVAQLVDILVGERGKHSRPQLAIIDLDTLSAGELFHLHRIRELGWGGTLVTLGKVPLSLRSSLGIDRTIAPPYTEDSLREEIVQHREESQASTMPIPIPML
jgi:hypothetical protein